MDKVIFYSEGPFTASVCVEKDLTHEEIVKEIAVKHPSGTEKGWRISTDTHFRQGNPHPCPCDKFPDERLHYLVNC